MLDKKLNESFSTFELNHLGRKIMVEKHSIETPVGNGSFKTAKPRDQVLKGVLPT